MILHPNCKINIGLHVVRKREDGYHDLETIFYPVYGLHDELEITPSDTFSFSQDGITIDCATEDNLIVRCYRAMQARYPQIGAVRIRLKKNIPFGAGLGGGSSDAAHTAVALNEIFHLGLSQAELAQIVTPLGADCPFFVYNVPCFAEGIGDRLTPIDLHLEGKRLVMIKPAVAVSTRDAYSGIQVTGDRLQVTGLYPENDFETTVFKKFPILAEIKQRLLDMGAYYAAMSGSGSTIYGLFEQDAEGSTHVRFGAEDKDLAAMVIFNDTLTQTQS